MTELWNYERFGVPIKRGGRYFFTRNDGLQNQSVLYWLDALDAEPQLLLDPNTLSEDGTVALTGYSHQRGRHAAGLRALRGRLGLAGVARARRGDGRDLEDHLQWVKFSGASWTTDGQGFFYSRYDEPEDGAELQGRQLLPEALLPPPRHAPGRGRAGLRPARPEGVGLRRPGHRGRPLPDHHCLEGHQPRERRSSTRTSRPSGGRSSSCSTEFDASYWFVGNDGPLLLL